MTGTADLPVRGTCFGWEVRSELAFAYLRTGEGEPLEVTAGGVSGASGEPLQAWRPPHAPAHVRLYEDDDGFRLWIDGGGWFGVEPGVPRITVPEDAEPVRREERTWGLPALLCFLARGDVPLHASAVEIDGRALLLAGPRRGGKTTLAMAFAAAGHRVLSEDLVCIRPGRRPAVVPGPAMLRVRHDVVDSLDLAAASELGRDEDRAHLSLEGERGTSAPVPVAAIAFLHPADVEPRLEAVEGAAAVRDLWSLSFNLPTSEDRTRCFRAVGELASTVPTWRLLRRLRLEDLRPTLERLAAEVRDAGSQAS